MRIPAERVTICPVSMDGRGSTREGAHLERYEADEDAGDEERERLDEPDNTPYCRRWD